MALDSWEEKYRAQTSDLRDPDTLIVDVASRVRPGHALDLACGTGRNALWLAQHGWHVTAVDGSAAAIETLCGNAARLGVTVDARIADLENNEYAIEAGRWDLVALCYYLQRDLFARAKAGVSPGGFLVTIALMMETGKEHSPFRVRPGELRSIFEDWEILQYRESIVAELVARRPLLP